MAGANIPDIAIDPEKEILKVHKKLSSFYDCIKMYKQNAIVILSLYTTDFFLFLQTHGKPSKRDKGMNWPYICSSNS